MIKRRNPWRHAKETINQLPRHPHRSKWCSIPRMSYQEWVFGDMAAPATCPRTPHCTSKGLFIWPRSIHVRSLKWYYHDSLWVCCDYHHHLCINKNALCAHEQPKSVQCHISLRICNTCWNRPVVVQVSPTFCWARLHIGCASANTYHKQWLWSLFW